MIMSLKYALLLATVVIVGTRVSGSKVKIDASIVNKEVKRKVDLSSSLVKISSEITLENTGSQSVTSVLLSVEPGQVEYLSSVVAYVKTGEDETQLAVEPAVVDGAPAGSAFFEVTLPKPIAAGKSMVVTAKSSFTHMLQPFPAEIKQAERQLVKYLGNLYLYSPYKTISQKTVVALVSSSVESYTKTKTNSKSDSSITYGPFEGKAAYSEDELMVHYENNTPFLAVTSMLRVIEVSHWGNIAVEETYDIRHTGAKLKGPFSRYDYQRQPSQLSSVKSFKTVLPASATGVYYRDEIGNISTSHMKEMDDAVELELRPRFPLFGGWKTHYVIGYNVPSYQYLWTDGGSGFALKMPFVDHVFDNQVIDDIVVKIILPEGSDVSQLSVPFEFRRGSDELHATYLDTIGRPVIVMSKSNLIHDHIKDFTLKYSFNRVMLLREPFLVVGFFYLIFLFVIIYVRLDFSIARDEAAESKLKVSGYVENAQNILDRRAALYQTYDDAVNKYKASKDLSAYQAQKKKVESDHKSLTSDLTTLQAELKAEGADAAADKIAEIQKCDSSYKDSVLASAGLAEKLVNGKMPKDTYLTQEEQASKKRAEIMSKIENLASQL